MKKHAAFTLIELLFVLALLGLVLGLAFIRLDGFRPWQEAREIRQIKNDLYLARNLGVVQNQSSRFRWLDEQSYEVLCGDQTHTYQLHHLRLVQRQGWGVLAEPLVFTASGSPSQAGHFLVRGRDQVYRFTIPVAWTRIGVYKE